ncbi:MAG: hypothetical protein PHF12_02345 [Candidatus Omnitrophica bacterium]|jgi:hypothetical protein|nr:hypothetical protein [Candidatus Omnitrophota bacterium]
MALACRICIATKGLKGSEIGFLPQNEEELLEHLERVHHMPVTREGETEQQATVRFLTKHPEARECPECRLAGAPWTRTGEESNG